MITSNPMGDWTWELPSSTDAIRPRRAAETAVAVWNRLAEHGLANPVGRVSLSVRAAGNMGDVRIDSGNLNLEPEPLAPASDLSRAVDEAESLDGDLLISTRLDCPGFWLESGVRHRVEKLFVIQVDVWKSSLLVVTLETYSDAWLKTDTRDREQPEVYAANAPRLSAALEGISDLLGSAPEPGDPSRYAVPTETGFQDTAIEGPAYDDSWGTFEIPARSGLLRSRIPWSEHEYEETTEHPVRYFTIQRDKQTLGYLWASVADDAAGYEPRTAAGEAAFEAGSGWLLRLRAAHGQGLTPLSALDWVAQRPPSPEIGMISEDAPREAPSLDSLEDLSGRY